MPCNATGPVIQIRHSVDRASWYVLIMNVYEMHYFSYLFDKVLYILDRGGTVVKCCATIRKVAGSIPDGFIGIFYWHNPSDRSMVLE